MAIGIDPGWRAALLRLAAAMAASAAAHVAVLVAVPVNTLGESATDVAAVIFARLAPGSEAPAAFDESSGAAREAPPPETTKPPAADGGAARPAKPGAGLDLPIARDPTYYPARQLDVYPTPLTPIDLRYPEAAAQVNGKVTLLVLIDESGLVTEVAAVESQPAGVFDESARAALQGVRFAPAMKDGRVVKSRVLIEVQYDAATGVVAR